MLEVYRTFIVAVLALGLNTLISLVGPKLGVPADVLGIAIKANEGISYAVAGRAALVTAAPAVADTVTRVTKGIGDAVKSLGAGKRRQVGTNEDTDPKIS